MTLSVVIRCVHGCTRASSAVHAYVHACMYVFGHVCVQLNVVHGCMHGACTRVCEFSYVMTTCSNQIRDDLVAS